MLGSVLWLAANLSNITNSTVPCNQSGNSSSCPTKPPANNVLWELAQTIFIIMIIIVLGYFARLSGYIPADAEKGIGQIAGRVALPALLASLVAQADLGAVNWSVIFIDLGCKLVVIGLAGLVALCAPIEGISRLTLVGAYGFFVTNANYMAIGVPLLSNIFGPDKVLYLVIMCIVQQIILNPALFMVILCGEALANAKKEEDADHSPVDEDDDEDLKDGKSMKLLPVFNSAMCRVLTDPVVLAGLIGLGYNVATQRFVPALFRRVLTTIGNAFALCALFNLGMGVVGHLHAVASKNVVVPLVLIFLKSFVLPLMEKQTADLIGLDNQLSEILWVAGTIGTAASTAIIISQFVPSLGVAFRSSTVLNLILGLPLLLLSGILFTADDTQRQQITQYGRDGSNMASIVGLSVILLNFITVPRWKHYPMWLLLDLAVIGLPFYVGHYFCHNYIRKYEPGIWQFRITYFITNMSRLARRGYLLALAFMLLAQIRWDEWCPSISYGYKKRPDAQLDESPRQVMGSDFAGRMHFMHWVSRAFAFTYALCGTLPFMLFATQTPLSGFSCWCAYGNPQWAYEFASFCIIGALQGGLIVAYICNAATGQDPHPKQFSVPKFAMAVITTLQFISLCTHTLVLGRILQKGAANFQVDSTWLQPLIVLIVLTDGGGCVMMLILQSSATAWEAYRRCCFNAWVAIVGRTDTRQLRSLALHMCVDPELVHIQDSNIADPSAFLEREIEAHKKQVELMTKEFEERKAQATLANDKTLRQLQAVHGQKFSEPFSGSAAIDWMLKNGGCVTRELAEKQLLEMRDKNLLVPCDDQPLIKFVDADDFFYRVKVPEFAPTFLRRRGELEEDDGEDENDDEDDDEDSSDIDEDDFEDGSPVPSQPTARKMPNLNTRLHEAASSSVWPFGASTTSEGREGYATMTRHRLT